jgi:hypothetical protein
MNDNHQEALAKTAFDAFQWFASPDKRYTSSWDCLTLSEKKVFERIAVRVSGEISLRLHDLMAQLLPTVI